MEDEEEEEDEEDEDEEEGGEDEPTPHTQTHSRSPTPEGNYVPESPPVSPVELKKELPKYLPALQVSVGSSILHMLQPDLQLNVNALFFCHRGAWNDLFVFRVVVVLRNSSVWTE